MMRYAIPACAVLLWAGVEYIVMFLLWCQTPIIIQLLSCSSSRHKVQGLFGSYQTARSGRADMLTGPVAAARAVVGTGAVG